MNTVSSAIADLRAKWHTLPDYDRARALLPIIRAGVSRRQLAIDLGTSEGSVRNLLLILEADLIDLLSFRRGEISKNELIRRVRGVSLQPEIETALSSTCEPPEPPLEPNPIPKYLGIADPTKGCEEIIRWLREDRVRDAYASEILGEAGSILAGAEKRGSLPRDRPPAGMTTEEVIRHCRPDRRDFDFDIAWYAFWLALSAFHLIPDVDIRRDAFNMAIEQVSEELDRRNFGRCSLAA